MFSFVSLARRPDLRDAMWSLESSWPQFMLEDPIANRLFGEVPERFPELQLLACEGDAVIGRITAVPFSGAEGLPERGWDAAIEGGVAFGEPFAAAVSLLEARIAPPHQNRGLSARMLGAMRDHLRARGVADLYAPVRPTAKSLEPQVPMTDYAARRRADGLPFDPWLRVHVRLGAVIGEVCATSMTIPGTLSQWRAWTGLALDRSGPTEVPGALVPVHVSVEQDHAVYVEPNVWVHHRLAVDGELHASSPGA